MRKILSLFVISLLVLGGYAYADNYAGKNYVDFSGRGGPEGITPPTEVVRVRYGFVVNEGLTDSGLSSGDVVCWDCNSSDGITISGCVVENAMSFAGVLVEDIATADSIFIRGGGDNWGYIAVSGYAVAKIDTSLSTTGQRVITAGDDGTGVDTAFITGNNATVSGTTLTNDVGVLLRDSASDSVNAPVWLD